MLQSVYFDTTRASRCKTNLLHAARVAVAIVTVIATASPLGAQSIATISKRVFSSSIIKKMERGVLNATLPSGQLHKIATPATAETVQIPVGGIVLARSDSVARPASVVLQRAILEQTPAAAEIEGAQVADVPIEIVAPTGTSGAVTMWKPFVIHPPRLSYDSLSSRFTGRVLIGLRMTNGDAGTAMLTGPVAISVVSEASVDPDRLAFAVGPVEPTRVEVTTNMPADSVSLQLHANGLEIGEEVRVSLALPTTLRFENPPPRFQAFGTEPRWVTVGTYGASLTRPVQIRLGAGAARIEPDTLTLTPGRASARVLVTAEDVGPFRLTATGEGVYQASEPLTAVWPVRFALAIVLGGLAGALFADSKGKRQRPMRGRKFAFALAGTLIAVPTWVGLNQNLTALQVSPALLTTLGAFALAAVAAAFGITVERLLPVKAT